MPSGYSANMTWNIDDDDLRVLVPEEYENFTDILTSVGIELDDYAAAIDSGNAVDYFDELDPPVTVDTDDLESIQFSLNVLIEAFAQATKTTSRFPRVGNNTDHLTLYLSYYDSEQGGPYDDLDEGAIWCVGAVEEPTPAGHRFMHTLNRNYWVHHG